MMNNLILDCSAGMGVYLDCDGEVFSKVDNSQNKHSDEILKVVDELMNQAKINIKQIDNICICVGPGSFTGVRVAVSLAKGLAIGSHAKVFTLSNFDIFDIDKKDYYLIFDGFSDFVYTRKFSNGIVIDECVDVNEFVQKREDIEIYVTTEKMQNLLKKYEICSKFAQNQIILAFKEKIKSNETVDLNQIYPIYLRPSQAEIERAKKL